METRSHLSTGEDRTQRRLSSSEIRPPVLTPSMKSPRLRVANVPSKQAETSRISVLSRGRVPFILPSFHLVDCFRYTAVVPANRFIGTTHTRFYSSLVKNDNRSASVATPSNAIAAASADAAIAGVLTGLDSVSSRDPTKET